MRSTWQSAVGASGCITTHSSAEAESLIEEIERLGSKAVALPAHLTSEDQLRGLAPVLVPRNSGPPTCLINNAARFEWDSVETLDWTGWQAELDVNLRAPIFLTQAFARTLPEARDRIQWST